MPQKIECETGITEDQIEYLLTGTSWGALAGDVFKTPIDEKRAWKQNRASLLATYLEKYGEFSRPWAWWQFDAVEPRQVDEAGDFMKTEAVYLEHHAELLTKAEKEHLQNHGLTRWQQMPVSEMTDVEDYKSQNYRDLLSADELAALEEHLASTKKESIQ